MTITIIKILTNAALLLVGWLFAIFLVQMAVSEDRFYMVMPPVSTTAKLKACSKNITAMFFIRASTFSQAVTYHDCMWLDGSLNNGAPFLPPDSRHLALGYLSR